MSSVRRRRNVSGASAATCAWATHGEQRPHPCSLHLHSVTSQRIVARSHQVSENSLKAWTRAPYSVICIGIALAAWCE
jgi:hypothetical protein